MSEISAGFEDTKGILGTGGTFNMSAIDFIDLDLPTFHRFEIRDSSDLILSK